MKVLRFLAVASVAANIVLPTGLDSCAIGLPTPLLVAVRGPADLRAAFVKGKIGVIQPTYGRRNLIAAYRVLTGKPLSVKEFEAFYPSAPPPFVDPHNQNAMYTWDRARGRVQGVQLSSPASAYKSLNGPTFNYYFRNCMDDAFESAGRTLEKRAALWGWDDQRLREWTTAQQGVFSNCSGPNAVIPAPPNDGMDPLLAADRRYQIAASYFYAGEWQKSREAFQQIAKDETSPWRGIAPYLIARSYIREGTIAEQDDALRTAVERLTEIENDPAQKEWHKASRQLLEYVRLRIEPHKRIAEFASTLLHPSAGDDLAQSVTDFAYLYGRGADWQQKDISRLAESSDLADWLLAFEGRTVRSDHFVERWRETHSPAWLIAALRAAEEKSLPELLQSAHQVQPNAPGYESAVYFGISRAASAGQTNEARSWADEALRKTLQVSTRNLILGERLKLARNWTEFLRYAPRRPEPGLESYDGHEQPISGPPQRGIAALLLDQDAAGHLNHRVPLSLLIDAGRNALLPEHIQLQIAQAAWMRAALLGRHGEGRQLMERIVQLQAAAANAARGYLRSTDAEASGFEALFLILRAPTLNPMIESLSGPADLSIVNRSGGGGWGFPASANGLGVMMPRTSFLNSEQSKQAEAEHNQLEKLAPAGATYLAAQAVRWAQAHPDDNRVPEALHIAVQATRNGFKDERAGEYSRQAFLLLHQRYPKSEWAAKTKYWYK